MCCIDQSLNWLFSPALFDLSRTIRVNVGLGDI